MLLLLPNYKRWAIWKSYTGIKLSHCLAHEEESRNQPKRHNLTMVWKNRFGGILISSSWYHILTKIHCQGSSKKIHYEFSKHLFPGEHFIARLYLLEQLFPLFDIILLNAPYKTEEVDFIHLKLLIQRKRKIEKDVDSEKWKPVPVARQTEACWLLICRTWAKKIYAAFVIPWWHSWSSHWWLSWRKHAMKVIGSLYKSCYL